jgi:hypothetical protein
MLKNKDYDLIQAISIKSKSLHRYNTYIKDAEACPGCRNLWQQLKNEDEKQVGMLVDELKNHAERQEI